MKRGVKLYNVILPLWLLLAVPSRLWLLTLPANFIADLAVSAAALRLCGAREIKKTLKTSAVRTWLWGFAADFAGAALMLAPLLLYSLCGDGPFADWLDDFTQNLMSSPAGDPLSLLWTLAAVALSAFIIYRRNYNFCFRRADLTDRQRRFVALALAAVTAPWFFFIPTSALSRF